MKKKTSQMRVKHEQNNTNQVSNEFDSPNDSSLPFVPIKYEKGTSLLQTINFASILLYSL